MKGKRVIINIEDNIPTELAVGRVYNIIREGRISEANNKKHYCWGTKYADGIMVGVKPKYGTDSDIFIVYRESNNLEG